MTRKKIKELEKKLKLQPWERIFQLDTRKKKRTFWLSLAPLLTGSKTISKSTLYPFFPNQKKISYWMV
jgi:hypothetical protein